MRDIIRVMAEEEMGCQIPPEEWTPEERGKWKRLLHGRMYSAGPAVFGRLLTSPAGDATMLKNQFIGKRRVP